MIWMDINRNIYRWCQEHNPWLWHPITWAGHSAVIALTVLIGAGLHLLTPYVLASHGYAAGLGYFILRETNALLRRGKEPTVPWYDYVLDVVSPAVVGGLVLRLVA